MATCLILLFLKFLRSLFWLEMMQVPLQDSIQRVAFNLPFTKQTTYSVHRQIFFFFYQLCIELGPPRLSQYIIQGLFFNTAQRVRYAVVNVAPVKKKKLSSVRLCTLKGLDKYSSAFVLYLYACCSGMSHNRGAAKHRIYNWQIDIRMKKNQKTSKQSK